MNKSGGLNLKLFHSIFIFAP